MSLNIKIRDIYDDETTICVNPNMTIGDAKKLFFRYIRRTRWMSGKKILFENKTFSDYFSDLIGRFKGRVRYFIIHLVPEPRGGAGFGLCTIDVEKNNTRIIELDYNAPPHRNIDYGLSVQAICENDIFSKIK